MPHFAARPESTGRGFRFSRLVAGYALLGILFVCAPRSAAGSPIPATTTTLSVSPSGSVVQGTVLTLQATVSAGGSAVSRGSVTFSDGTTVLGSAQLVNVSSTFTLNTANLKVRLGPGSHTIKAVYGGVLAFLASTSATQTITVTSSGTAVTTTAIASSGSAGAYTLMGKVTALSSSAPTGNVSFLDQSNSNLALGSAAIDAATLTSGWQSFTASVTASSNYGVIVGDLNGDGIPDVVTSNYTGTTISVLLGNGDGTFLPHVDYAIGAGLAFGLALGDVNGDGYPDIAVAFHGGSNIGLLLGNGDGTFQAMQTITTGDTTNYVALADLNHDGNLDLITLGSGTNVVAILLGHGDGTFAAVQTFGTGGFPYGLTVGDFNNDGNLDVAVSNTSATTISVLLGNGDGTLQAQTAYAVGANPRNLVAVDLNLDGNQDLVVCNGSTSVSVLLGNGDGSFAAKVDYPLTSSWGVATADVNGDGFPDIVATTSGGGSVTLFQGKGDGTFQPPVATPTGASSYLLALADLNGDGVVDLVVSNLGATAAVRTGLGSISATATLASVSIPGGGSHDVVASYAGDTNSALSTSSLISLTGSMISTSLSVNVSPNSASLGQSVALTATVAPSTSAGYTSSGTVIFSDGGVAIGSAVTVSNGHAVLSESDLAVGDHAITAVYSGDTNFAGSTSSAASLTVSPPDYSITATPVALTIHRGQAGTATLTVTPTGGYTGPIAFTCAGLPQFATCTFLPASLQLDGSNTAHIVQFKVDTSATTASLAVPAGPGSRGRPMLALLCPCLALSLFSIARGGRTFTRSGRSRSKPLRWLQMLVLAMFFLGVAGCGSSSKPDSPNFKVPLGTSTVTANAAAVGGSATHSATITVTVVQ